jgi:hypothetical protein
LGAHLFAAEAGESLVDEGEAGAFAAVERLELELDPRPDPLVGRGEVGDVLADAGPLDLAVGLEASTRSSVQPWPKTSRLVPPTCSATVPSVHQDRTPASVAIAAYTRRGVAAKSISIRSPVIASLLIVPPPP